jgi:hypothetical protein
MSRISEQLLMCPTCGGNAYVIVERDDGTRAIATPPAKEIAAAGFCFAFETDRHAGLQ